MEIDTRIALFKADLPVLTASDMVQKHITYGPCYALDQLAYFRLKSNVAQEFHLHPTQVLVVGSAKLGFSVVQGKRYEPFRDASDIDIAIVDSSLFDSIWLDVFNYSRNGGYWSRQTEFCSYLFQGWIRPDKLPPARSFSHSSHWWEFFRQLSSSQDYGPFPLKAGLYRSWHFLEVYQSKCVDECKRETSGET